jgi:HEAT repeat protein
VSRDASRSALPSRDVVRGKVVPALVHLLESERANDTTTGALMALARIGEPADLPQEASVVPRMIRALSDANQEIAETSALALGILRSETALPSLVDLLAGGGAARNLVKTKEVSQRTRAFAAYGLGLAAHEAKLNRTRQWIARSLLDVLGDPRAGSDVEVAAVIGLSLDLLDVEPVESTTAPWISRQTLLRFFLRLAVDAKADRLIRAHALTAIARLSEGAPAVIRGEALEVVLEALSKDGKAETEVALSALQALGALAGPGSAAEDRKARLALYRAVDAPDPQARAFSLISLAQIGGRDDDDGGECRAALSNEVTHGRSTSRAWAAVALGLLERSRMDRGQKPGETTRQILREWFNAARGRNEVGAGAIALGLCRDPRAEAMLRSRLADSNEDTGQGYVALALGMIGSRDSVPALRDVVKASRYHPQVLEQAAEALALLGDKETAADLAGLLAEARGLAAQTSYAGALGFVGDARAVDPLLVLVARKELPASARGLAAAALGGVAEESFLPWRTPISFGLNYRAVTASLYSGDGTGLLEIL